jgi:hypothetical protein
MERRTHDDDGDEEEEEEEKSFLSRSENESDDFGV